MRRGEGSFGRLGEPGLRPSLPEAVDPRALPGRPRGQKTPVEARRPRAFLDSFTPHDFGPRARRRTGLASPPARASVFHKRPTSNGFEDRERPSAKGFLSPHNIYLKFAPRRAEPLLRCKTTLNLSLGEKTPPAPGTPCAPNRERSSGDCFVFRELCNLRTLSNSFLASLNNEIFLLRKTLDNEKQFLNSVFGALSEKLCRLRLRAGEQLDTAFRGTMEFLGQSVSAIKLHRDSVDRLINNFDKLDDAPTSLSLLLEELRLKSGQRALPSFDDAGRAALLVQAEALLERFFAAPAVRAPLSSFDIFNSELSSFKKRFSSVLKGQGAAEPGAEGRGGRAVDAESLQLPPEPEPEPPCEAELICSLDLVCLRRVQAAVNENEESLKKLVERSVLTFSPGVDGALRDLRSQASAEEETGTRHSSVFDGPQPGAESGRQLRFDSPAAKAEGGWLKKFHLRKNSMI